MNLAAGQHYNYITRMEAAVFKLKSNNRRLTIVLLDSFIEKLVCISDVSLRVICNSLLVWQSRPPKLAPAHPNQRSFVAIIYQKDDSGQIPAQ